MGKYLPDKIRDLTKAKWKTAREEAGFKATAFGGPAVGSKIDEFIKMRNKCRPKGAETDIKKLADFLVACKSLHKALAAYQKKASKEGKKQNIEFAQELGALAAKMQKKINKYNGHYAKLKELYDEVTDGKFSKGQKAVEKLMDDLLI